jgi:hypothetical protein
MATSKQGQQQELHQASNRGNNNKSRCSKQAMASLQKLQLQLRL